MVSHVLNIVDYPIMLFLYFGEVVEARYQGILIWDQRTKVYPA